MNRPFAATTILAVCLASGLAGAEQGGWQDQVKEDARTIGDKAVEIGGQVKDKAVELGTAARDKSVELTRQAREQLRAEEERRQAQDDPAKPARKFFY